RDHVSLEDWGVLSGDPSHSSASSSSSSSSSSTIRLLFRDWDLLAASRRCLSRVLKDVPIVCGGEREQETRRRAGGGGKENNLVTSQSLSHIAPPPLYKLLPPVTPIEPFPYT